MRGELDVAKLKRFMNAIGNSATGPGTIYLTGGASAVLIGWRNTTIDVDIKLDPEPKGVFDALSRIKNEIDVNIELAAPDQFIPAVPGWRERSQRISRHGLVEFLHYDFVSQALSKIERGYDRDLADVRSMIKLSLVDALAIGVHFEKIESELSRYPSIEPSAFREKVESFISNITSEKHPHG